MLARTLCVRPHMPSTRRTDSRSSRGRSRTRSLTVSSAGQREPPLLRLLEPIAAFQVNPETHRYAHTMAIVADTEFGGVELGLDPEGLSFDVSSEEQGWYVRVAKGCLPFVETRVHVAGVLDGEELRLYKNGELVDSKPFPGAVKLSHFSMRIGCSPHPVTGTHEMFCGRIDEVRFSRAAQYTDRFKPPAELEVDEATDALYHFDEGRGDKVRDASGKNQHGVVQDARWVRVGE